MTLREVEPIKETENVKIDKLELKMRGIKRCARQCSIKKT